VVYPSSSTRRLECAHSRHRTRPESPRGPPMSGGGRPTPSSSRDCPEGTESRFTDFVVPIVIDRRGGGGRIGLSSGGWRPRSGNPPGAGCLDPGDAVLEAWSRPGGAPIARPVASSPAGGGYLPRELKQQIVSSRSDEIGQLRGVQSHGRPALPATLGSRDGPTRSPASFEELAD